MGLTQEASGFCHFAGLESGLESSVKWWFNKSGEN